MLNLYMCSYGLNMLRPIILNWLVPVLSVCALKVLKIFLSLLDKNLNAKFLLASMKLPTYLKIFHSASSES